MFSPSRLIALFFDFEGIEQIYVACAVLGGVFFVMRLVIGLFVGDGDSDFDGDADFDGGGDTDVSFKLISLQGLTAFFMVFGISGLALIRDSRVPNLWSIVGATICGLLMVALLGYVTVLMHRMQSSGNIDHANAVGEVGAVYLTIAENDSGQVQVTVQGHQRIYNAVAKNNEKIETGARIKVLELEGANTLVVERIAKRNTKESSNE